jgi:hypothetical protein
MSNIIDFNSRFKEQPDKKRETDKPLNEMTREDQLDYLYIIERRLDAIIELLEADSELAPFADGQRTTGIGVSTI